MGYNMHTTHLLRLLPTMPMILETLTASGWSCQAKIIDEARTYRSVRLFHGQAPLYPDILYLLRPEETTFPTDHYSYVCTAPVPGLANHIVCPDYPDEVILDALLELFSTFQEWEQMIDQLTYRNASLQELCELGAQLLENPVCLHDDWFMMIAMSQGLEAIMAPEYITTSTKGFIPRVIVDDFKYDSDYLETYAYRNAQIWHGVNGAPDSLYANLWDGTVYQGRLLVIRHNREFRQADFILAEVLAQRAIFLLHKQTLGQQRQYRSMDDIVFDLIQGNTPDPTDLTQVLNMLNWQKNDRFLCIRIRSQQPDMPSVMEHVLHSDLFQAFPGSYILFTGHEQCLVLNLSKETVSQTHIQHHLAPICRDYCLYAGISSPVSDIRDLHFAYYQANIALNQAFQLRSDKWIIAFSDCALEHILTNLHSPLPPWYLAAPELLAMREHDREKGTQYFETFREYLLQERDIPKTAEKLIIHRTTLLYRLRKIQSLIHVNLDDPWKRLYLTLSLWILETETHNTE